MNPGAVTLEALRAEAIRRAQEREKERLAGSLAEFFRAAWTVLEPGRELVWSWHYDLIIEYLELIRAGKFPEHFPEAAGLIVNVPPRTAKSTLITVCYPVWCWIKRPERRFMCVSYSAGLSTDHSVRRRDLIKSAWFQERWADRFEFKYDVNQKEHFANDRTGEMIATSVGGTATGQGGDDLILDDPLNPDQAASDVERKNANDWIDSTLKTRLNNPAAGLIVLVMQRLHELDATGHLLSEGEGRWVHLKIAAECEEPETHRFPVSGREIRRPAGDVLQPDRFPPRVIGRLKVQRLVWAGQYQQRPAPLEGNLIKRKEARHYGGIDPLTGLPDPPLPDKFDFTITSTDAAFKDLESSDFVASAAIGVKGPLRYILEVSNLHLDEAATEELVLNQRKKHGAVTSLVEDKANGPAIISRLKRKISGLIAVDPQGGKVARMFAVAGEWQAGNWYVDRTAAWTEPFLSQICAFPNAAHDDMADMMSQAGVWLQQRGHGLLGLWQQQAEERAAAEAAKNLTTEQVLGEAQKRDASTWMQKATKLGKVAVAKEAPKCGNCGNPFLTEYQDFVKCNACGWSQRKDQ